jgi:hypothetical protein
MSRSNILQEVDLGAVGYAVQFAASSGEIWYLFSPEEGVEIAAGADPQMMSGKRINRVADALRAAGSNVSQEALKYAADTLGELL